MTDGVRSKLQKFLEGSDEYAASAHVDYLNIGEVIDIMPLKSMQRRLLRTRYLKPRLNNLRRGRTLMNYYRLVGLLKTLTGVLVNPASSSSRPCVYFFIQLKAESKAEA